MRIAAFAFLAAALGFAPGIRADTLTLKDGTVREGTILRQDAEGVTFEVKVGSMKGAVHIPKNEIAKIERKALPADTVETEAAALRDAAEKKTGAEAADAWVKLGDFYAERSGYSNPAQEAYKKALATDPENAKAHQRLGHVKTEKGWQAVDEEKRAKGLVQLDNVWVRPAERAWLIDKKDKADKQEQSDADDLRIAPRKPADDKFTKAELEKMLKMRQIEEELARREGLRVQHGESFLQRYGYYGDGNGVYIGPGQTPVVVDGVGIGSGNSEFFVGNVSSGYFPYYSGYNGGYYSGNYGGWNGFNGANAVYSNNGNVSRQFRRNFGYSPGFVSGNFAFGTNFHSGYGGYGGFGGFGINLSGGSKNFRYNIGIGGFSGSSYSSGFSGFGW